MSSFLQPLVAAACICVTADEPARDYEIKLARPVKTGDAFRLVASGSSSTTMTGTLDNGVKLRESVIAFDIALEGVMTVMEVNREGEPVQVGIDVEKCVKRFDGKSFDLAEPGSRLIATLEGTDTVFELDGQPLAEHAQMALGLVCNLSDRKSDDEAICAAKGRKKVGDTWPMDAKAYGKFRQGQGEKNSMNEKFSGTTEVLGVKEHRGAPCLELKMDYSVQGGPEDIGNMNRGAKVLNSTSQVSTRSLYPHDLTTPAALETTTIKYKMDLVSRGPGNSTVNGKSSTIVGIRRECVPIKSEQAGATKSR